MTASMLPQQPFQEYFNKTNNFYRVQSFDIRMGKLHIYMYTIARFKGYPPLNMYNHVHVRTYLSTTLYWFKHPQLVLSVEIRVSAYVYIFNNLLLNRSDNTSYFSTH